MSQDFVHIRSRWTDRLRVGEPPSSEEVREHLLQVHQHYPGFTESCAVRCRDTHGRNSYEWLADLVEPEEHGSVLDLACGSGVLGALCLRSPSLKSLVSVDMSTDELALAQERIQDDRAVFRRAFAQDLGFLDSNAMNAVLCHWALTLMEPVEPVLSEVGRVLKPGGIFGAIVDGPDDIAVGYQELNDLIFRYVVSECPGYATVDLGDPRVRDADELVELAKRSFPGAGVSVESGVVALTDTPETLANEAVQFFYASFVLSEETHRELMSEVVDFFRARAVNGLARFEMPIHRLVVTASA
ncbi:MAG: class I SAM-dependent methyltransferase [Myxococcota bacterium]